MVAKVSTCVHPLVADTAVDKRIFLIRFVPIATPTQLTVATFTPQPAGQKQQQPMKTPVIPNMHHQAVKTK
jgi:hypothetical protein